MSIVLRGLTLLSLRRREEARKTQEEEERARGREINTRRGVSWYYYGSMNERREFIKIC